MEERSVALSHGRRELDHYLQAHRNKAEGHRARKNTQKDHLRVLFEVLGASGPTDDLWVLPYGFVPIRGAKMAIDIDMNTAMKVVPITPMSDGICSRNLTGMQQSEPRISSYSEIWAFLRAYILSAISATSSKFSSQENGDTSSFVS